MWAISESVGLVFAVELYLCCENLYMQELKGISVPRLQPLQVINWLAPLYGGVAVFLSVLSRKEQPWPRQ